MSDSVSGYIPQNTTTTPIRRFYTEAELEEIRLRDLELLGRSNYAVEEDKIIELSRTKSRELPLSVPPEISPIEYLRSYAPNRGSNHQIKHTKITTKTTASERAKITMLDALSSHGKKAIENEEFTRAIMWGFSANGNTCEPFWLRRGDGSPDVELHEDHHIKANRSHCDSLGCASPMCCELSARERASGVADKISFVERITASSGGKSQIYHVFVSPPQELGKKWMNYSGHFEEMSRIVSVFMERGLGLTAYSVAFHPWRGRKEKDRDEALRYVGEGSEASSDNPYFWRLGPHFHVLGVASGMCIKSEKYLRKMCKELYNLTGWIVHIKRVETHPELVWKYVLTHVGLGFKEGSRRALPSFRNYGLSSPRGINKIDLGHITKVRPCPKCGGMCNDLLGGLSSVRSKFNGYALKMDKKSVLEDVGRILSPGRFEVGKTELLSLLRVPDLFIPRRAIPRYVVPFEEILEPDHTEKEPEIYHNEERPVSVSSLSMGQIYDTLELLEFLGENHKDSLIPMSASETVGR